MEIVEISISARWWNQADVPTPWLCVSKGYQVPCSHGLSLAFHPLSGFLASLPTDLCKLLQLIGSNIIFLWLWLSFLCDQAKFIDIYHNTWTLKVTTWWPCFSSQQWACCLSGWSAASLDHTRLIKDMRTDSKSRLHWSLNLVYHH